MRDPPASGNEVSLALLPDREHTNEHEGGRELYCLRRVFPLTFSKGRRNPLPRRKQRPPLEARGLRLRPRDPRVLVIDLGSASVVILTLL